MALARDNLMLRLRPAVAAALRLAAEQAGVMPGKFAHRLLARALNVPERECDPRRPGRPRKA